MGRSFTLKESIAFYMATVGGLGKSLEGRMPGTAVTLLALLIRWIYEADWYTISILFILGVWSSERLSKFLGERDPSPIVIDEFVGYFVAMWNLDEIMLLPSFFLFRLLDIVKPFPVNLFERLPGGWGIMMDDVAAGFLTNGLILLGLWFWGMVR
ncbi:MAG: phosphatidylglycerophosphatase A [Synergistetes bacterium]|nr:MAG: Phosphatidylglycerophosphatase A [bacterium 42_11]MBC7331863.1 phosphatidylglycerophosphatase A [Synergistota bacterium]MDK2871717.1 phosphatidylglycerophosphatase [bacterium]